MIINEKPYRIVHYNCWWSYSVLSTNPEICLLYNSLNCFMITTYVLSSVLRGL